MKLLVDGVCFQHAHSGAARVWRSIVPALVAADQDVLILDRGGLPTFDGAQRIPFPAYKDLYTADDSSLIQRVCDAWRMDVFTSTGYTTPLTTPMFLLVSDMTAEIYNGDQTHRQQQERSLAISYARRHICVSPGMRDHLLQHYPGTDRTVVAHLACDRTVFRPVDPGTVMDFRRSAGLDRRRYIIIQPGDPGRDTSSLIFEAIAEAGFHECDILLAEREPGRRTVVGTALPATVTVKHLCLSDGDLAAAYSGAAGFIYPSLHEGSDLTVLEALACGCPVVTTLQGAGSASDACLLIDGLSRPELVDALRLLGSDQKRQGKRRAGLAHAMASDPLAMVSAIVRASTELAHLATDPEYCRFASTWRALRQIQSAVDVDVWR